MKANDRHNDLNVTWTVLTCFVGAILIFVFIIAVQILFHWSEQAQYRQKVVAQVPEQLSQLRSDQEARINSYRLVDQKRGIAAIPVGEAMLAFARDPAGGMEAIRAVAATQPAPGTQPAQTTPADNATGTQPGGPS
jgi:hypothetical protein